MNKRIILSRVANLKEEAITTFIDGSCYLDIKITILLMKFKEIEEITKFIKKYDDFKITIEPLEKGKFKR